MLGRLLKGIAEFIYPKVCLACKNKIGSPSQNPFVCGGCLEKIERNLPPFCFSCGRHLEKSGLAKNLCPVCQRNRLHFDRAFSPCVYKGVVKDLVHAFKYGNKDYLGDSLGKLMVEFIREYSLPMDYIDYLIPVPLHTSKLREREFNQAEILARTIAADFKKDILADSLTRHRHTKTQTGLETKQRFANVRGSFLLTGKRPIKRRNILLIDDVLTTGATASEAAKALKDAGAGIVFVLTLAN